MDKCCVVLIQSLQLLIASWRSSRKNVWQNLVDSTLEISSLTNALDFFPFLWLKNKLHVYVLTAIKSNINVPWKNYFYQWNRLISSKHNVEFFPKYIAEWLFMLSSKWIGLNTRSWYGVPFWSYFTFMPPNDTVFKVYRLSIVIFIVGT